MYHEKRVVDEIFIRKAKGYEKKNHHYGFSTIEERTGYDVVYKPYGKEGTGYYYIKEELI
jgi:hypothetical protein